jgi:tetratricopeptide (TPR) repeat protein
VKPAAAILLGASLALGACGGGTPADTGPPPDTKLDIANKAGTQALSMDMPVQAVRQYKLALTRAYERDDTEATAYNLALAQMRAGDPKEALRTAREARAELDRRHVPVPAELALVQSAAAYRAGDLGGAAAAAQQVLELKARDPDTVPRAWFIRGLVAAERGDGTTLAQAIAALPPSKQADIEADRQELMGRAALLAGQSAEALVSFERSAANRQQALDYRGMARVLAMAGEASLKLNRTSDAAVFFLRAGRTNLLQGDAAAAMPLLKRAEDLAKQTSQTDVIEEIARLRKAAAERAAATKT